MPLDPAMRITVGHALARAPSPERRRRSLIRRFAVLIAGTTVLLVGVAISPLPGPGLTVLGPLGLTILAGEFLWARRLLSRFASQERSFRAVADRALAGVSRLYILPVVLAFWTGAYLLGTRGPLPETLVWALAFPLFTPVAYLAYRVAIVRRRRAIARRRTRAAVRIDISSSCMTTPARTLADMTPDDIRAAVAERYGRAAQSPRDKLGFPVGRAFAEAVGYDPALLNALPAACVESFTGAGNPRPFIDPRPGETALDLGCGAGLDLICTARALGPRGRIYGLDLSPTMLDRTRAALQAAGLANAELLEAPAERIPLEDASVDLITANGIVNLSPEMDAVIAEMARVCRPGGRLVFAEIVLAEPLDAGARTTIDDWFRCIGGALLESDLLERLRVAGFRSAEIVDRRRNARTGHAASRSAVIRAVR